MMITMMIIINSLLDSFHHLLKVNVDAHDQESETHAQAEEDVDQGVLVGLARVSVSLGSSQTSQWTSCQRKISTSSHHLDYADDSDIIDDLNLIPADHNLHILLHLNVSSLLVVNVLPVVLVANSEELHLEDPDDGGTERHRASADANWI